jgi:hypothetical protein
MRAADDDHVSGITRLFEGVFSAPRAAEPFRTRRPSLA